nr:ABC transporter permease [uncultured Blautia sp.]
MSKKEKQKDSLKYFGLLRISSAILLSLAIVFVIILVVSQEPVLAIQKMMFGPLESKRNFFNVLERSIPLIFSALALNIVLRSGVFSIAADGSFYMGAVVATAIACKVTLPNIVHQCLLLFTAGIIGGLISAIPIWLNKITKVDATVLSIMFNSIFYYLGYSIVSKYLLEKSGQWGSAYFPDTARLGKMVQGTSLHWGFVIMIVVLILVIIFMEKSSIGYKIRLSGSNANCAKTAGIKVGRVVLSAAFISGIVAGIGGAVQMVGTYKRFQWQSPVNYVWDGLMIHMMASGNPLYIPLAAIFIAYLRVGSEIMSRATDLDNEIVAFFQCIMILLVVSENFLGRIRAKKERENVLRQVETKEENKQGGACA